MNHNWPKPIHNICFNIDAKEMPNNTKESPFGLKSNHYTAGCFVELPLKDSIVATNYRKSTV